MNLSFRDWRTCSQSLIPLTLDKDRFYYIQAQAWALKGYIGGTHSYSVFWSNEHNNFLIAEYTDAETVRYQTSQTVYSGDYTLDTEHAPFITARPYNAQWFGKDPYIVDSCPYIDYSRVLYACKQFPLKGFNILHKNCNTFTSYLHWALDADLKRPVRSVGYKSKKWWNKHYGA